MKSPSDPIIELKPVESSNISEIGYNEAEKILAVRFKTGKLYYYLDVPKELWDNLNKAQSIGSFVNANLVKSTYKYSCAK